MIPHTGTHTHASYLSIQHTAMPPLLPVSSPPMLLSCVRRMEILSVEVKQPLTVCMLNLHMGIDLSCTFMTYLRLNLFREECEFLKKQKTFSSCKTPKSQTILKCDFPIELGKVKRLVMGRSYLECASCGVQSLHKSEI